jgi:YVTN family beta-propeller protein
MRNVNHRKDTGEGRAIELGAAAGFPIVARIAVRQGPISGIVASPDGTRLMVANYGYDSVSVIDTDTCGVVQTVAGLPEPFALAVGGRDSQRAYVSTVTPAYDSIAVIDLPTDTVIATHPLAFSVSDLAVSPDGDYVYAGRHGAGGPDVAVLDVRTGRVEEIALPNRPGTITECVRSSADGSRLYVGTNGAGGGQLVMIDPHAPTRSRVLGTVEIGLPIRDVALSPNGAIAYVASCAPELGAVIDVVDTRVGKIVGTSKISEVGGILTALTLSGDGDRAYLVSDEGVAVLSTLTHDVVGTIGVAHQPSCVVESADARYLYIADYSGTVTVAPVASVVALGVEAATGSAADWAAPELLPAEPVFA